MAYCIQQDLEEQISQDELIQLTDDRSSLASGALNGSIDAVVTTITLSDSSGFPASGRIKIDNEEITYTGNVSNQLTGCSRGAGDTTPVSHSSGATVYELNRIDTSVITRAIADADAEIDSYCASEYDDLPFATTPGMIRKISVDITIYNLFARRKGAPLGRKLRYDNAVSFLTNVAKGLIRIGVDAPVADDDAGPEATTKKSDRIFSMGAASGSSAGTLDNF